MAVEEPDMTGTELARAVFRWVFGTDAEMAQPSERKETDEMLTKIQPKKDLRAKINEANESIDRMRESTGRLASFEQASNLDEALRQIAGRD